jgi:DDE superfamily endonuclease
MAVRTYAPCGQTPIVRVKLTRDHLSAIGAITPQGRLSMQQQDHASDAQDVVRFLRLLLRRISGNLLVIWDGAPIHRANVIKDFLRARGRQTAAFGTLAGLCAGTQPAGGGLESAQTT